MKKIAIILILAPVLFCLASCSKTSGCTDPNAENFSASAEADCHCCTYEGGLVFWYGQSTSAWLASKGVTSLTYYLDGSIVGSSAANVYWTGSPSCGQNGSVTATKNLGEAKSKAYDYKVMDQTSKIIWSGVKNLDGNTCLHLELTP